MFRPRLNGRCGARLGTGIVAHNDSTEVCNVQIRGAEGSQWSHRPLTLDCTASEVSTRVKNSHGVASGNPRRQSAAMLASMASLCPESIKQSSSIMSDSWSGKTEDMESSAESGGIEKGSTVLDGDSGPESQPLLRSTSGASMVMSEGGWNERVGEELPVAGSSTEEKEGENEVDDEDVNSWNEPESPTRDSDSETHSKQREPQSAATTWTDDKHSSFLNSMEASFVKSLYSQGLGGMGVYGNSGLVDDSEQDCVESRPVDAYGCCSPHPSELFELLQGGSYQQKAYYRPHGLEPAPAPAVLANPWVKHFKQRVSNPANVSSLPSASLTEAISSSFKEVSMAMALAQTNASDGARQDNLEKAAKDQVNNESGGSEEPGHKEMDSGGEVPELDQGLRVWQNRLQSWGQISTNPTNRKDTPSWMLKRPSSLEVESADVFHAKRSKSTQQELARKDLEMLEQYVAKQRVLAESGQAVGEQSEQMPVIVHKVVVPPVEEASPLPALEHRDVRKLVGRSAMDQVVPLLGRTDSYDSKGSLSVPDLNMLPHLCVGSSACTASMPQTESCGMKGSMCVPDLNTPLCLAIESACTTTSQPTISFSEDGEPVATAWSPRHNEAGNGEDRWDRNAAHELAVVDEGEHAMDGRCTGGMYHHHRLSLGKHGRALEGGGGGGDDDSLALEIQTQGLEAGEAYECEPQLSPVSLSTKAKTWTWGLRGLRQRLHEPLLPLPQPSSRPPQRDGKHFVEPSKIRKQFCDRKVDVGSSSGIEV